MSIATVISLDAHAPVRPARAEVATPLASVPTPTSAQLTVAIQTIEDTGWLTSLADLLPRRAAGTGGRTRSITLEASLVAALCLPLMSRPLFIRDIARLLDKGLDEPTRRRLGIAKGTKVTERMASYLYNQLTAAIDPSCYSDANSWMFDPDAIRTRYGLDDEVELDTEDIADFANINLTIKADRLEAFIRTGLVATHPSDAPHAGDYAMDATFISSWENPKTSRRRTKWADSSERDGRRPLKPWLLADPEARWWSKKGAGKGALAGVSDSGLGYAITAITRVDEDNGPEVVNDPIPYLIEHISVTGARGSMWREGARTLGRMVTHHETEDEAAGRAHRMRGDLLADREYSRVATWQACAHTLGFTPHFMLAAEQRGHTKTLGCGALVIDGLPYSPGIPEDLRETATPPVFATRTHRAIASEHYGKRAPYRLKAIGSSRADNGSLKLTCPASTMAKHAVRCANKPASLPGRAGRIEVGTALPVITATPKPAVCAKSTVTVSFDDLPFWQPHIPYTAEHQWSINRRNQVESAYGRIKDEATQSLRRGTFRVFGKAKVTFAVVLVAMAANLLEVARWRARIAGVTDLTARRGRPSKPSKRVPRKLTLRREAEAKRLADWRAKKAAEAAAADEAATGFELPAEE